MSGLIFLFFFFFYSSIALLLCYIGKTTMLPIFCVHYIMLHSESFSFWRQKSLCLVGSKLKKKGRNSYTKLYIFVYFSAVSNLAYCTYCYLFQIFHVDIFIYLSHLLGKLFTVFSRSKGRESGLRETHFNKT